MSQLFADISSWQVPDPRLDAMQGVMIKTTQGISYISPNFPEQENHATSLNLEIGKYHFADGLDPVAEAEYFVANSNRIDGQAQALDVEATFYTTVADPVGWCLTFLQTVEKLTNNKPGIYLSFSELQAYDWSRVVANGNWLWIAEWNGQNNPTITQFPVWTMWQYADTNVSGGDSDIFNGDVDTFKAIAKNNAFPTQTPVVSPAPGSTQTTQDGTTEMTDLSPQSLDTIHQFDNEAANTIIAEVRANATATENMVAVVTNLVTHIESLLSAPAPTVNVDVNALAAALASHITIPTTPVAEDPATLANLIAGHLQNTNIDALAAAIVKQIGVKLSA